jgi:membrane-associated protease RseP (regulator of RpoE activity)
MALVGFAIAALFIGAGVAAARWLVSRAFGVRGTFREVVNTGAERGRPALAYARALASIAGIYLACVLLFVPGFGCGGTAVVDDVSMRVTVMKDGPAERAGVVTGDRIVSVNGESVKDWDQLKRLVAAHPDETIAVDVERGPEKEKEKKTFSVTTVGPKMLVGPFVARKSLSGGEVLASSFRAPYGVVRGIVRGLARSFEEKPELSGPVGIAKEVSSASEEGPGTFFRLMGALASYQGALISMVLLGLAFFMGFVAKRTLPTSGNSS